MRLKRYVTFRWDERISTAIRWVLAFVPLLCLIAIAAPSDSSAEGRTEKKNVFLDRELANLERLKEKEGRDNAIIYYTRAAQLLPESPNWRLDEAIHKVRRHGWGAMAKELLIHLEEWRPALDEIRKGAEVDYASNPVREFGVLSCHTTYLPVMRAVRILSVEGRYFESQGMFNKALRDYFVGLTIARDLSQPRQTPTGYSTAAKLGSQSLRQIYRLAISGNLQSESLDDCLLRLNEIERNWGPIIEAFQNGRYITREEIQYARASRNESDTEDAAEELRVPLEDLLQDPDTLIEQEKKLREFEIDYLQNPYWERDRETFLREREKLVLTFRPYIRWAASVLSFEEEETPCLVMKSHLSVTQIATAVARYKQDHGRYPAEFEGLAPGYLSSVPVDPFSGQSFGRRGTNDGSAYSVGPDQNDDGGEIEYDATNGTVSRGDVFLR